MSEFNDKRQLAKKLWVESDEKLRKKGFLKEIAKQLNIPQEKVYKWKRLDNWECSEGFNLYEKLKYSGVSKDEFDFLTDLDIDEIKELKRTIRECDLYIINYEKLKSKLSPSDPIRIKYDAEVEKRIKIKLRCIEYLLKIEKFGGSADLDIKINLI